MQHVSWHMSGIQPTGMEVWGACSSVLGVCLECVRNPVTSNIIFYAFLVMPTGLVKSVNMPVGKAVGIGSNPGSRCDVIDLLNV